MRKVFLLVLMLAVVIGMQYVIGRVHADVVVSREQVAGNPTDRYAAVGKAQGTVVVAHGFAASKELMQYWGYALARQGFDTYLYDQPGHGEQVGTLPAWRGLENNALGENLRAIVAELIQTGRARPGNIALVGHSMGGATVVATGLVEAAVAATVAVSPAYSDSLPADKPVNLLSLVAERDPASIRMAAAQLAPQSESRKRVDVADKNHVTILYDADVIDQASAWIHTAFGTKQPGPVGPVAPWGYIVAALAGGLGALLAVASLLAPPEVRTRTRSGSLGFFTGAVTLAVAALSAVLAAVYLRTPWLGVAVIDYLLPYFGVAAVLLYVLRIVWPRDFSFTLTQGADSVAAAVMRGTGIGLAYLGAVVPVIHMNLAYHLLTVPRILPTLLFAVVLWLYFVQEEGLKRAVIGRWGPLSGLVLGLMGKLIVVATWLGASALPNPPVFLALTIPVTLVVLLMLELLAALLNLMRFSSATTATLNAIVLAWACGVSFPLM